MSRSHWTTMGKLKNDNIVYPLNDEVAETDGDKKDKSDNMKYGLLFSTAIPLILFIFLSGYIVAESIVYVRSASLLNRNVKFGIQVMNLIHNLQSERDLSAIYYSSNRRGNVKDIDKLYKNTDASLYALDQVMKSKGNFATKNDYKIFLDHRRNSLTNSVNKTVTFISELDDYNKLIEYLMSWLVRSINVEEATTYHRELVALQQATDGLNSLGLLRAIGAIIFTTGKYSKTEYKLFVYHLVHSKNTLNAALEYSVQLKTFYDTYNREDQSIQKNINSLQEEILNSALDRNSTDMFTSEKAMKFFDSMTVNIDNVFRMILNTRELILMEMNMNDYNEKLRHITLGLITICSTIAYIIILGQIKSLIFFNKLGKLVIDKTISKKFHTEYKLKCLKYGNIPPVLDYEKGQDGEMKYITLMKIGITKLITTDQNDDEDEDNDKYCEELLMGANQIKAIIIDSLKDSYVHEVSKDQYPIVLVSGLDMDNRHEHVLRMAKLALELQTKMRSTFKRKYCIAIAINTGPSFIGYDETTGQLSITGNLMENLTKFYETSPVNTIHISYSTLQILEDLGAFQCYRRKTLVSSRVGQFPTGILKSINENYDEILQTEQSWDYMDHSRSGVLPWENKIGHPFVPGDQTTM